MSKSNTIDYMSTEMINTISLIENMKSLGLTAHEIEIVRLLYKAGPMSVTDISKNTEIPRSSIYRHIDDLEKKGWVKYILSTAGRIVDLTNLSALKNLIKTRQRNIKKQSRALEKLIETINASRSKMPVFEKVVRYYEGKTGMRQIHWNTTYLAKDSIRVFTGVITKDLVGEEWYVTQLIEASRKKIPIKILVDKEYSEHFKDLYKKAEKYYEPLPKMAVQIDKRVIEKKKFHLMGKMMIYNDVIALLSEEKGKLSGVEIESKHLSLSMKSIFDMLWEMTTIKDRL